MKYIQTTSSIDDSGFPVWPLAPAPTPYRACRSPMMLFLDPPEECLEKFKKVIIFEEALKRNTLNPPERTFR